MSDNRKKLILKVACLPWKNESRDKRELSVCRELGYDVAVLAKGEITDKGRVEYVDGFKVHRYSVRPFGGKLPHSLSKLLSIPIWAAYVRRLVPYAISGHDLSGLTIGWISTLFLHKSKKPKLIYDSHEFELGRNSKRGIAAKLFVSFWERFLIKRCVFSVMVNDTIADEVQKIHGLENRPIVVRSTPEKWEIDIDESERLRQSLLAQMSEPKDFVVLYHGAVVNGRGIENLIRLLSKNADICGIILGNGSEEYLLSLRNLAVELGVDKRLLFYPAVSYSELGSYVSAVDVGMVNIMPIAKSYYFCLPNKFFECIQSLTPVIASDFPELKRVVGGYGIGLCCDPEDVDALNECVERMRTDRAFYESCCENLRLAKEELCWEKEKHTLINAYKKI